MQLYTKILIGMVIGALLGVLVGPNSALLPADGVTLTPAAVHATPAPDAPGVPLAGVVKSGEILEPRPDGWARVAWTLTPPDVLKLQKKGVEGARDAHAGDRVEGWVSLDDPAVSTWSRLGQRLVDSTEWIGRLFIALIKMVVVPLVFASLCVGVASLGDFRRLGRMGGRTLALFTGTTVVALIIGMGLANLIRPGELVGAAERERMLASFSGEASAKVGAAAEAPSLVDQLVGVVPTNPLAALAGGDMLQIIFFALMLGIALTLIEERRARAVVGFLDGLNEAMVMLVHIAMKLAPYGVAALLFKVVGTTGFSILVALAAYSAVVLLGLGLHLSLTYGLIIRSLGKLPFLRFLGAMRPAMLVAFSTSSSSATLPVTKECVEDNVGVSNQVSSFVLPLGATVNMDGTALYQGVAALFIAQIYGMDLSFVEQGTVVVSATLASVGAAGVPGAGMITLTMVLTAVGVPTEGIALVLGVDRLLDMFRTSVNVVGDATASVVIARSEGEALRLLTREEDASDHRHGFEGRLRDGPHAVPPDEA